MLHLVAALLVSLSAQDKENPEFQYWADHKPGSWVKLKMEMEAQGQKIVATSHHTLLEIGKDKAVVEQKTKVAVGGAEQPEEVEKEEILKDKDKDPVKIEKEGEEEITVAGKKLKCRWIEGTQSEMRKVKFWLSKEVPGGVVKAEASGGEIPGKMLITATAWEKK